MRITIVGGFFLPVPAVLGGSTEKIWHRLAREFAAAGHQVTIVSRRWPGWPDVETEPGGRIKHLRLHGCAHTRLLPLNLLLDFLWGLQVAWHLPTADIVVCNTVSLPVYLRWIKPSAGRVAVVLGRMPKGQNRVYHAVDVLLATSTAVADKVRAENERIASRIFKFPNPIDWRLHQQAASGEASATLTIGYIGRIHPEKGLEQMLDAAVLLAARSDLPPWRLQIVGPVSVAQGGGGEVYRDDLMARYGKKLGHRLEILPPEFEASKLAACYGRMAIFCYPSLAAKGEGLSIAPMEAMAAGAIAVVSQLECYRDLIIPGVNGIQFDHTRPDAVAQLCEIFAHLLLDPSFRQRIARQGQIDVQRHDYPETARILLGAFERLLGGRAKG